MNNHRLKSVAGASQLHKLHMEHFFSGPTELYDYLDTQCDSMTKSFDFLRLYTGMLLGEQPYTRGYPLHKKKRLAGGMPWRPSLHQLDQIELSTLRRVFALVSF